MFWAGNMDVWTVEEGLFSRVNTKVLCVQIVYAKIVFPRTHDDCNVMDAACRGAQFGMSLIGAIIANIVAFVSFVAFVNAMMSWFGGLVGFDEFSFEVRVKAAILTLNFLSISFVFVFSTYSVSS